MKIVPGWIEPVGFFHSLYSDLQRPPRPGGFFRFWAIQNIPTRCVTIQGNRMMKENHPYRGGDTPMLIPDTAAARMLGISRATLWRRVASGEFPAPIKLGGRTLWRRDELLAVVERATAERDGRAA